MKVSIMQPYFFPYLGYFQLMAKSDIFVIYDDVQFMKGGWINRNKYLNKDGTSSYFSLPLEGASANKNINQIAISPRYHKVKKTLLQQYANSNNRAEATQLINDTFADNSLNLATFVGNSVKLTAAFLGIKSNILFASDLDYDRTLKAQQRVISLCRTLQASTYINNASGSFLYDANCFANAGMQLALHHAMLDHLTPHLQYASILELIAQGELTKGSFNE